jgi:hypothetical protein
MRHVAKDTLIDALEYIFTLDKSEQVSDFMKLNGRIAKPKDNVIWISGLRKKPVPKRITLNIRDALFINLERAAERMGLTACKLAGILSDEFMEAQRFNMTDEAIFVLRRMGEPLLKVVK